MLTKDSIYHRLTDKKLNTNNQNKPKKGLFYNIHIKYTINLSFLVKM